MKSSAVTILVFVGLLAFGCGSGDSSETADAVDDAAASTKNAAEDAVNDATETAEKIAEDNPVTRCLKLAAEKNWKDALAPCAEAAKTNPDDLSIKHALQQAQAAAEE
jgi:hypothetical protein